MNLLIPICTFSGSLSALLDGLIVPSTGRELLGFSGTGNFCGTCRRVSRGGLVVGLSAIFCFGLSITSGFVDTSFGRVMVASLIP